MGVARVQFGSVSGSGTSPALTLGASTTAGNLLVVAISADGTNNAVPTSVALTGSSDTFAKDSSAASVNPTAGVTLSLWNDPNCSGGHTQITATFPASVAAVLMMAWEISGAALSSPLAGQSPGENPANTLQAAFDSGAAASVPAGCFWVGAVTGIGSGGRAAPAPSGSWTTETPLTPGSLTEMLAAYQAGPGAGAPEYSGPFSAPAAGAYWAAVVGAYKAAVTAHTATASLTVTPVFSAARTRGKYRTGSLAVTPSFSAVRTRGKFRSGSLAVSPSFSAARAHGHGRTASLLVVPSFSAGRRAAHVRSGSLLVAPSFQAIASGGAALAPRVGSWYGLSSVFKESRQEFDAYWSTPPTACPVCGQPLEPGPSTPRGATVELFCNYAGDHSFVYPRDWHPPTRPVPSAARSL